MLPTTFWGNQKQPLMEWQAQRHGPLRRFKPGSLRTFPETRYASTYRNGGSLWWHDGSMGRTVYSPTFPINFSQR